MNKLLVPLWIIAALLLGLFMHFVMGRPDFFVSAYAEKRGCPGGAETEPGGRFMFENHGLVKIQSTWRSVMEVYDCKSGKHFLALDGVGMVQNETK